MTDEITSNKDREYEIVTPAEVADDEFLVIPLKRALTVQGIKCESIKLRYPNRKDMKFMNKNKKLSDDERVEVLLCRLAIEPDIDPETVDTLAQSDFLYIQKRLDESGFFGVMQKSSGMS